MNNTPLHIGKPPQIGKPSIDLAARKFDKHVIEIVERLGYIESSELLWTYEREDLACYMTSKMRIKFWEVVHFLSKRQRIIRVYRAAHYDSYDATDPYTDEPTVYYCSPEYVSKMVFSGG